MSAMPVLTITGFQLVLNHVRNTPPPPLQKAPPAKRSRWSYYSVLEHFFILQDIVWDFLFLQDFRGSCKNAVKSRNHVKSPVK